MLVYVLIEFGLLINEVVELVFKWFYLKFKVVVEEVVCSEWGDIFVVIFCFVGVYMEDGEVFFFVY